MRCYCLFVFVDDVDDPYEVGSIDILVFVDIGIPLREAFYPFTHDIFYHQADISAVDHFVAIDIAR